MHDVLRMMRGMSAALLLPLLLVGSLLGLVSKAGAQATAAAASASAPVIPVETLFRKSEYRSLTFSPDQKFMAALMPINSRYNLVVINLEKRNANRVTSFDKADVLSFWWASSDRLLFTTGDTQQFVANAGDGGLFAVDRDGRNSRILIQPITATPGQYVFRSTSFLGRIKDNKEEVRVAANDRVADSEDIYRMNMFTGRKTLVTFDSPGKVSRWILDRANTPRAAWQIDGKNSKAAFYYRSDDKSPYKKLREWDYQLNEVVIPVGFDADGKTMFVASNIGRDAMAQDTQPAQRFGDFGDFLAKQINGDQKADREMFERTSPVRHVAKIQAPVFHAYGGEDRNVDIENGRVIRSAFDKAGKPQEWMFVANEAHGYRLDSNVFEYYNRFDAFMKKYTPTAK